MDDAQLKARAWAGAVDFQRLVGRHAPGATLHERDGVVTSVLPGVSASILNAAIAHEPLPQSANATAAIARLYEDSDVAKWGVWIDADDGEIASVAMIHDVGDDAFVTFVATIPQARGRGLATNLLKTALHEAKQRGRHTTTLQASKPGQGIYAAIGFRPLGEQHLWERRP